MTALDTSLVIEEIANGLDTQLVDTDSLVSSVYDYQKGVLNGESPVLLVLENGVQRSRNGIGARSYDNNVYAEIHILVYDGDKEQPIADERERERKVSEIEKALADWFSNHQTGTYYRSVDYTYERSQRMKTTYLDGNPYILEVIPVMLEKAD